MRRVAFLGLLIFAGLTLAELKITGELKVKPNRIVRLAAEGAPAGAAYIWDLDREDAADVEESGSRFLFTGPPGTYKIKLRSILLKDGKTLIETARATVTIEGDVPPVPPGPVPPGPVPPGPTPGPAPIPLPGLRVLMVYESADLPKLSASQQSVLYSTTIRQYLRDKCAKASDGTSEFRVWDKDVDASADGKHWGEALKRERKSLPWIVVSDGKTGYEGPLPETIGATLDLLKKYGG